MKDIVKIGIVAGCVIKQDGKYLMVQEKQPKVYGLWNVPAGYVDLGETIEQGAIRECKEEAGYDVELLGKIGIYQYSVDENVRHAYLAKIIAGELTPQPEEILDAKWLEYTEIEKMNESGKIRARWVFEAIKSVEQNKKLEPIQ